MSKKCCEKKKWLFIIDRRRRQKTLVLIKYFNTFMYDHTLHRERKDFCRYSLQSFSAEEILKCHINDCFKINGKQRIIMPKKVNALDSNIMREK